MVRAELALNSYLARVPIPTSPLPDIWSTDRCVQKRTWAMVKGR